MTRAQYSPHAAHAMTMHRLTDIGRLVGRSVSCSVEQKFGAQRSSDGGGQQKKKKGQRDPSTRPNNAMITGEEPVSFELLAKYKSRRKGRKGGRCRKGKKKGNGTTAVRKKQR